MSFADDKQLVLFAVVPAVYDLARGKRASTVIDVIVTVGAASAAVTASIQYGLLHFDSLGKRPQGISHHYMTFSGFLMLVRVRGAVAAGVRLARPHLAGAGACRPSSSRSS